jgi:hypothetical protein
MDLYNSGAFSLPEQDASTSNADKTAETLKKMIDDRRANVQADVEATLAAFDVALTDGTIKLDNDPESFERIAIEWTPPENWHLTYRATVKALATKTRMSVSWNGCPQCPIWFRPFTPPPVTPTATVTPEQVQGVLRALTGIFKGAEPSAEDSLTLAAVASSVLERARPTMSDLVESRYIGRSGDLEGYPVEMPCPHVQKSKGIHRKPYCSYEGGY